jgi:hypothetical protein
MVEVANIIADVLQATVPYSAETATASPCAPSFVVLEAAKPRVALANGSITSLHATSPALQPSE